MVNILKTIICADIGTSSLKAALIKSDGTICAFSRVAFDQTAPSAPNAGACPAAKISMQKPNNLWLCAFQQAVAELLQKFPKNKEEIEGICISGNGPTFANRQFCHLWNDFNGTPEQQKKYREMSGFSLFLPRLFYLKENCPALFNKSASDYFIFSGPEYLIFQLTNCPVTVLPEERFEAAYWNADILQSNGILPDLLPPFVKPGFCAGTLTANAAAMLNLGKNCKVYCGMPDFCAALVGTATTSPGMLCDRAGSSEGLNLCTQTPITGGGIRTLPSVISGLFNAAVLLPDSGHKFGEFKINSIYKDLSFNQTVEELLQKPGSTGFKLMENIALDVKNGILLLEKHWGKKIETMRVTGGQAHTPAWNQFKAEICQIKIEIGNSPDAELTGDAVTAFYGMGLYNSLQDGAEKIFKVTKEFVPGEQFNNLGGTK